MKQSELPTADQTRVFGHPSEMPPSALEFFAGEAGGNAESSPEWFANLQAAVFQEAGSVCYAVHEAAGATRAVLPMRREKLGNGRWLASLSNYYTSLYAPPVDRAAACEATAACLAESLAVVGPQDAIRFAPMDPDGVQYGAIRSALQQIGWVPFEFFCFGNWYLRVETSWRDYLAGREGALRSTIKRKGRKFESQGGRLEIVTEAAAIDAAVDAYNQVYAASWKKPEPFPEFVPGLIRWLAAKGELRLGIAWLGEQPIAAQIWIVKAAKAAIFKLAYDEAYAEYAAGTLLTACLMEHVIDVDHVAEVDYLIGDDPYKRSWMSARRERWGIVAYNPRTVHGLLLTWRERLGRATRPARRMVRSLAVRCRDFLHRSRRPEGGSRA